MLRPSQDMKRYVVALNRLEIQAMRKGFLAGVFALFEESMAPKIQQSLGAESGALNEARHEVLDWANKAWSELMGGRRSTRDTSESPRRDHDAVAKKEGRL